MRCILRWEEENGLEEKESQRTEREMEEGEEQERDEDEERGRRGKEILRRERKAKCNIIKSNHTQL